MEFPPEGGNHDLIEHNTFVYADPRKDAAWKDEAAIWVGEGSRPCIVRNVISQYQHGLIIPADATDPSEIKDNLFDTTGDAMARAVSGKPSARWEGMALSRGNRRTDVHFVDRDRGNYCLADDPRPQDRDVGTRRFQNTKSPWPALPEERDLLDRLSKARVIRLPAKRP